MRKIILLLAVMGSVGCSVTPAMREDAKVWSDTYHAKQCMTTPVGPDQQRCLLFNNMARERFGLPAVMP